MRVFIEKLHGEIFLKEGVEFADNRGKGMATIDVPKWAQVYFPIYTDGNGRYTTHETPRFFGRIYLEKRELLQIINKPYLRAKVLDSQEVARVFESALKESVLNPEIGETEKVVENIVSIQEGEHCDYLLCNGEVIAHIKGEVITPQVATKGIVFEKETGCFWGIEKQATLSNGDKYVVLIAKNGYQEAAFINPHNGSLLMFVFRILEL